MKVLLVLCLGVIAVQTSPALKGVFDDIVRELAELSKMAKEEQAQATDTLGGELKSFEELSHEIIQQLGEDLARDARVYEVQVHDLQLRARDTHVSINQCVGDQLKYIAKLPELYMAGAEICTNGSYQQATVDVNEGLTQITSDLDPIEGYYAQLEICKESDPSDQEDCVAALLIEVQNDQIEIPSKIRLVVEEVLGQLVAEKSTLLLCVAGRVEGLNEEGSAIVQNITDCAVPLFPTLPPFFKV